MHPPAALPPVAPKRETLGAGPHTALVLREAKLVGPVGRTFRGVRFDQGGAMALGDRTVLKYGGEYVLVDWELRASSLRPRADLNVRLTDDWNADFVFASMPSDLVHSKRMIDSRAERSRRLSMSWMPSPLCFGGGATPFCRRFARRDFGGKKDQQPRKLQSQASTTTTATWRSSAGATICPLRLFSGLFFYWLCL